MAKLITQAEEAGKEPPNAAQLLCKKLIKRAPDVMMNIISGFFVLGYRNKLLYFFIDKYLADSSNAGKAIQIESAQIRSITVKSDKKIICLQEIGAGQSGIVVEDLITREAGFMSIKMIKDESKKMDETAVPTPKGKSATADLGEILEVNSDKAIEEEKAELAEAEAEEGGPGSKGSQNK